ncbi:hypothetical protein ACLMJK_008940 [Lecanora helva]
MSTPSTPSLASDFTTPRARKQLTLYLAGASFFTLSTLLTRRAIHRKHLWPTPRFYTPSNQTPTPIELQTGVLAVEALQLATVNVLAFGMMMAGGVGWALDVKGWEEVRGLVERKKRGGGGVGVGEGGDSKGGKGEEELEELVGGLVRRGDGGGKVERVKDVKRREREERRKEREKEEGIAEVEKVETYAIPQDQSPSSREGKPWWRPW